MTDSLRNAVRAAIAHGNVLEGIKTSCWALTYRCTDADVEREWRSALSAIPPNSDIAVEGK